MKPRLPFRLGTTSYIFPADILPNVRRLAPLVDDVELVLFEIDDKGNLPSPDVIAELRELAEVHDVTYTVHLPLDLQLAAGNDARRRACVARACRVLACTRDLDPWAYVVHLEGGEVAAGAGPVALKGWRDRAARSLESLGQEAGNPRLLAVENLESYDPAAFLPLLDSLAVSLCIDLGHLVKSGADATWYLETHLGRARVIHLHGTRDGRDHRGLALLAPGMVERVLDLLVAGGFRGVLTLEVFAERHFFPGREMVLALMEERVWDES